MAVLFGFRFQDEDKSRTGTIWCGDWELKCRSNGHCIIIKKRTIVCKYITLLHVSAYNDGLENYVPGGQNVKLKVLVLNKLRGKVFKAWKLFNLYYTRILALRSAHL
jgi:hypothetical protein